LSFVTYALLICFIILIHSRLCISEFQTIAVSPPVGSTGNIKVRSRHANQRILSADRNVLDITQREIVASVLVADSVTASSTTHHSKLSISSLVINIVADLCPHGMMPLAYGLSQGSSGPTGFIPAVLLIALFGSMSAYTMLSYAELSKATESRNIGELWGKLISEKTKWVIDLSIFALCFGCCVFYSAFMGDIFTSFSSAVGLGGLLTKRWFVLISMSTGILLPLCLLEDLSALQFSSIMGVVGIAYTVLFHLIRLIDGSYQPNSDMLYHVLDKMQPSFPSPKMKAWNMHSGSLVLINMFCVAFLSHYNSINYYEEFDNPNNGRYTTAVCLGFGLSMAVFTCMMFSGYFLFGSSCQPLLLNNFPTTADSLASIARLATGLAITFAYPLMFAGLKSSMVSLLEFAMSRGSSSSAKLEEIVAVHGEDGSVKLEEVVAVHGEDGGPTVAKSMKDASVVIVLSVITAIAVQCSEEDVSIVLGIVGSVLGCFVAYALPGVLKLALMRQRKRSNLPNNKYEVAYNHALVALGAIFGGLGVWITFSTDPHS